MGPGNLQLLEREPFLAALVARLQAVASSGSGHAVLVAGEAGIGKTSLLRAFARQASHARLWWGACDALETPIPLAPFHEIARDEPALATLVTSAPDRARLFSSLHDALRWSDKPTLVVLEDVHWADHATLDLLRYLGRRIDRLPALLAMSFRDDEVPAAHPLRRLIGDLPTSALSRLELPRLSEAAVADLARRALRSAAGIHAATGGNPFFVTELLTHGAEGVPRTVQDVVIARFARLPEGARAIVQLASLVPARIERSLVEALLAPRIADVEACLDSGLLQADASSLHFRHELGRGAIEASLPAAVAQALHRRLLDALLSRPGSAVAPARLAHHAARAGDAGAILRFAPPAAREASARGAHREAAAHYAAALHAVDAEARAEWLEPYALECRATGRLAEAIAALRELEGLRRGRGDARGEGECLGQLAVVLVMALRNAEGDDASRRAVALLEALPPGVELARAWQVQAQLRMLNRDCREAVEWGRKAIGLAESLGDRRVLAAAHGSLGAAEVFLDYEAGCGHLRRAVELAMSEGLDYVAANNLSNLGSASGEVHRWAEARRHLREAIAFAAAREIDFYRDYATAWLALCELALGHWDDAAVHARESAERSDPASTARIMALVALGRLRTRRGEAGGGEALDEALRLASATGTLQRVAPVRCARAEAAWQSGDCASAAAEARAALELAVAHEHPWFTGELAYWLWKCGEPGATAPMFEPYALQVAGRWKAAAEAWAALGCPFEQARALEEGDVPARLEALHLHESLGAVPAAESLRRRLRADGVQGIPRGARPSTRGNALGLTAREAEVLELLRLGLRNSEIAERLVRSVRTVDHHIAAILAKLGVTSRAEAIRVAARNGQPPGPT